MEKVKTRKKKIEVKEVKEKRDKNGNKRNNQRKKERKRKNREEEVIRFHNKGRTDWGEDGSLSINQESKVSQIS